MDAGIRLDGYQTFVAASGVLLSGRLMLARIAPLRAFNIPEPVAGGVAAALLLFAVHSAGGIHIQFDTTLQTPFMLAFFATIGLSADLKSLRAGGSTLARFLGVVVAFLLAQNLLGVGLAHLLGLDPRVGLLAGSISLSGGHGTAAAWGVVADLYRRSGPGCDCALSLRRG